MRDFHNKNIVIMGLGLHGGGVGTARWFVKHGALVTVTDLRNRKTLAPSLKKLQGLKIRYVLGKHKPRDFQMADMVIQNPQVPNTSPFLQIARKRGIPIENEASIFFTYAPSKAIIGVTGTRGKSTTATLIHRILKQRWKNTLLAGNIRHTTMLDVLDRVTPSTRIVLELSSWHLEKLKNIQRSPHISVITNIYRDHLNRYPSFQSYVAAKREIIAYQKEGGVVVLNADNQGTKKIGTGLKKKSNVLWFSRIKKVHGAYIQRHWIYCNGQRVMPISVIGILGDHNIENVLAAITVAKVLRLSSSDARSAISSFRGIEGRIELIRTVRGVRYYNDTTATSPDAVISALQALGKKERRIVLIAGGTDKQLQFDNMRKVINQYSKALIVLPGTATQKLISKPMTVPVLRAQTMQGAVRKAHQLAEKGDVVLLSPGAASFGLFLHEFDRGDAFQRAVKNIRA